MKKILLILTLFTFHFSLSTLSAQSWKWGVQAKNNIYTPGNGSAQGICTDRQGNNYSTGDFSDTLHFGGFKIYSPPTGEPYIVKYDSIGNALWVQQGKCSGTSEGWACSVSIDGWGNCYATGSFIDTISFGAYTLSFATRNNGGYFVKYNSNSNLVWAQKFDCATPNSGNGLACDKRGNIYATGFFSKTMICGADTLKCGSRAGANVFIIKYDTAGHVIWARQSDCPILWAYGESVAIDKDYNVYVTGYFGDTTNFGSYQLIDAKKFGGHTVFLAKYDSSGNILWATQDDNSADTSAYAACGTSLDEGGGNSIAMDKEGNVYITGHFRGAVKFGAYTLSSDSVAPYLVKYASNGNVVWAEQGHVLDSNNWIGTSVATDTLNRVYLAALLQGNYSYGPDVKIVFDKDTFSNSLAGAGVLVEFDAAGNSLCGNLVLAVDGQLIVSCDPSGKYVNLGGSFTDTTIFGKDTLLVAHPTLPFMARWEPCPGDDLTGIEKQETASVELKVYPNPNNGQFTIQANSQRLMANSRIEIYNVLGAKVYTSTLPPPNGGGVSSAFQINLISHPNGVYLYRVIAENGNLLGEGKIVIEK